MICRIIKVACCFLINLDCALLRYFNNTTIILVCRIVNIRSNTLHHVYTYMCVFVCVNQRDKQSSNSFYDGKWPSNHGDDDGFNHTKIFTRQFHGRLMHALVHLTDRNYRYPTGCAHFPVSITSSLVCSPQWCGVRCDNRLNIAMYPRFWLGVTLQCSLDLSGPIFLNYPFDTLLPLVWSIYEILYESRFLGTYAI